MLEQSERRLSPEDYLLALTLAVMVGLNFAGIVVRYWLHISLPWIEEVEVGLFVWLVFLGAGLTVTRDIHIGLQFLTDRFLPHRQEAVRRAGRASFAAFFLLIAWFGVRMVLNEIANDQRTPTLGWPEWLIGLAVPLGSTLAVVRIVLWFRQRPS